MHGHQEKSWFRRLIGGWKYSGYHGSQIRAMNAANGVGRPPQHKDMIFDTFEELHQVATTKQIETELAILEQLTEIKRVEGQDYVAGIDKAMLVLPEQDEAARYRQAIQWAGSQRKAAAALGISLGKLQRELRKAG